MSGIRAHVRIQHELYGLLSFSVIVNYLYGNRLTGFDGEERAAPIGIRPYSHAVLRCRYVAGLSICGNLFAAEYVYAKV